MKPSLSNVRAMMMAAGAGTRLRPLTLQTPKPLAPVANKPVMEHALENAARHGLKDIVINLHHGAEQIQNHFGDGSRWGLRLRYSVEKKLMGTAGGVKKMEDFLGGSTFMVLSGDGLSEINLSAAFAFHKKRRSFATMVLKHADSKYEYGVTITDRRGRIAKFFEKPLWSDVFADTVNTGVYVFEPEVFRHIPAGTPHDFGNQVWPGLLKKKKPIHGFLTDDYWCDVGNLVEYRKSQRDAMSGAMKHANLPGRQVRQGVWVADGAVLDSGAHIDAPCVIGAGAKVRRGARVRSYSVLGPNVLVEENAQVHECILWEGASVGRGAWLENVIVGAGVSVPSGLILNGGVLMPNDPTAVS